MGVAGPTGRLRGLAIGLAMLVASMVAAPAVAQERVAVDRWLVSTPFPADDERPLVRDHLSGPGEAGVLPDRGRTVAGADWRLWREDSTWVVPLPRDLQVDRDSATVGAPRPVVAYAHAYIRAPADRTVRLLWGGRECTRVSAWLNGRRLDALGQPSRAEGVPGVPDLRAAAVRIGLGYNTLLVKAAAGDCEFGLAAGLEATAPGSLEGITVRASRPYGDTRTGPEPWILAGREAGPEALLAWQGEELFGAAAVQLSAFSVTAVEVAELKARAGGRQVKRGAEWLEPAQPRTILVPFGFEELREAVVGGEDLELEIKWDGGEWKGTLSMRPEPLLEAFRSPIRLLGWTGPRAPADTGVEGEEGEPHPLANVIPLPAAGEMLVGEWKVPGWLSGFTILLETSGAPGAYRLASVPVEGDRLVLCRECRKGETVRLAVESTGAWTTFPGVVILDATPAATGTAVSGVTARQWLAWIDEKGSREYRSRAAGTAAGEND